MILNAVIVKNKERKIKQILKTSMFYATTHEKDNRCNELRFYKNENIARTNYPKEIRGIIHITIDTENMAFFGKDNFLITVKPKFSETDLEYIFSFDDSIKDLHCKINIDKF